MREISGSVRFGLSHTLGKAKNTAMWAMVHGLSQWREGEARLAHSTHILSFGYEWQECQGVFFLWGLSLSRGKPGKPSQYDVTTVLLEECSGIVGQKRDHWLSLRKG